VHKNRLRRAADFLGPAAQRRRPKLTGAAADRPDTISSAHTFIATLFFLLLPFHTFITGLCWSPTSVSC